LRRAAVKFTGNAIILAGGKAGRRRGSKAFLKIGGVPIIKRQALILGKHFHDVIISCKSVKEYEFLGRRVVKDEYEEHAPIIGLYSALKASETDVNFCIACNLPIIHLDLIQYLMTRAAKAPAAAPESERGPEALYAVYRKECAETLVELIGGKEYSLPGMLKRLGAHIVPRKDVKIICGKMDALYRIENPEDVADLESLSRGDKD